MKDLATIAARFIWQYRFVLAAGVVLVTVLAGLAMPSYSVSNSLESWYPADDPELQNYRDFVTTYGSDEIVVVAVDGGTAVEFDSASGMALVGELTDELLDLDGVATVTSLVTVPGSLAEARSRLLSSDRHKTVLIVQGMPGRAYEAMRPALLGDIRAVVKAHSLVPHLGGYGVVFEALNEASTTGAATLIVASHLVMFGFLIVFFRRPAPVIVTIVAIGLATTSTMGLYFATGNELNMVTMVLPTLVLVIGTADCLHILRSIGSQDPADCKARRVTNGLAAVIVPCFVTTVTTAAGFLGLTASGLPIVRQLGLFGAAGVLAAFITAVVVSVAVLSVCRPFSAPRATLLDGLGYRLFKIALKAPGRVVVAYLVVACIAAWGIAGLKADTDSIAYLQAGHPVRQDSDFIEREIGPYVPVEFIVESDASLFSNDALDAIWAWQNSVVRSTEAGWSWSLLNALGAAANEPPSRLGMEILESRRERIRDFSPTTYRSMTAGDGEFRISFGAPIMSAGAVQAFTGRVQDLASFPPSLRLRPAGYSPLYTRIVAETVDSQVGGFGLSMLLILILLGLAMKSLPRVLLAIPANAVPVALTLGFMGLSGIPLDVASVTIGSVILGLVVDDSVHLLRSRRGLGILDAMQRSAERSAGTLIMTSLMLASGFLVLALADIRSIAWFGILASFAIIAAILSDLLLLPAVARLIERRKASRDPVVAEL
jgi:hypothetical protein